jgi:hypothetical protein
MKNLALAPNNKRKRDSLGYVARGAMTEESTLFPSVHAAIEAFLRAPRAAPAAAGKP